MEIFILIVSTVSMLITATALYFTVNSFEKQLQLNFFAEYTKRYQEITLNFPVCINNDGFMLEDVDRDERSTTLRYMCAYFDLCSEEYFLWKKGRIDNETWREWESGIEFSCSKPAFMQAWKLIHCDTIYYKEFTDFINNAMIKGNP